mmetsp:Transcript_168/g.310  ORF Transcript_168/g.310 Transcript_168/m.310 type:complete len:209 (-) Transcript_168:403-1029(-)
MLVHPTSTAASKGNRILHMLETPADRVDFITDVGALVAEETATSRVEEDVMVPCIKKDVLVNKAAGLASIDVWKVAAALPERKEVVVVTSTLPETLPETILSIDTAVSATDDPATSCALKSSRNVALNTGSSNKVMSNVRKLTTEMTLVGTGVMGEEVVGEEVVGEGVVGDLVVGERVGDLVVGEGVGDLVVGEGVGKSRFEIAVTVP